MSSMHLCLSVPGIVVICTVMIVSSASILLTLVYILFVFVPLVLEIGLWMLCTVCDANGRACTPHPLPLLSMELSRVGCYETVSGDQLCHALLFTLAFVVLWGLVRSPFCCLSMAYS